MHIATAKTENKAIFTHFQRPYLVDIISSGSRCFNTDPDHNFFILDSRTIQCAGKPGFTG